MDKLGRETCTDGTEKDWLVSMCTICTLALTSKDLETIKKDSSRTSRFFNCSCPKTMPLFAYT
uniref:Uncharacterized protein n=1 Tax=Arundo donax TaxID=35708 RepID=A0A0A9H018_ARUDO